MDFETFYKIKRDNPKAFQILIASHLKRSWFVSYHLTNNVCLSAPLLINAWKESFDEIRKMPEAPREDFREILYRNMLRLYLKDCNEDLDFKELPEPKVNEKYRQFANEIKALPEEFRTVHLFNAYGGLSINTVAEIMDIKTDEVKKRLSKASELIREKNKSSNKDKSAKLIMLATEFKNPTDSGFSDVLIPNYLMKALTHEFNITLNKSATQNRKEQNQMAYKENNKNGNASSAPRFNARKKAKINRIISLSVIAVVIIILGIIFIPKLLNSKSEAPTSVTTYNVQAVTYGDVDTTISGSGTLTPVTSETLTLNPDDLIEDEDDNYDYVETEDEDDEDEDEIAMGNYRIMELNIVAGEVISEDTVMMVVMDNENVVYEYVAPYELIVLDIALNVGDDLTYSSTIANVMGTDGFTMGIAVDELDISTVKVGQEVSFTISAVSGDYTGEITNVSYSGSESGGNTAYQITATVDYIEGVYPGMSADAEIVIESSGEGLLVPVSAVHTSGDDSYVYLAPSDATEGGEYAEDELDISTLTKVTVETGMSDGSYILVESDELKEGSLIIITTLTSTLTGSDSEDEEGRGTMPGGMGGMPGGMGGEGGFDFGDFDFGDFDPGTMPGGMGGGFNGMGG